MRLKTKKSQSLKTQDVEKRLRYTVDLYAAIPYTVEVLADTRAQAMYHAEREGKIPAKAMHLPALFTVAIGCKRTRRKRARE